MEDLASKTIMLKNYFSDLRSEAIPGKRKTKVIEQHPGAARVLKEMYVYDTEHGTLGGDFVDSLIETLECTIKVFIRDGKFQMPKIWKYPAAIRCVYLIAKNIIRLLWFLFGRFINNPNKQ